MKDIKVFSQHANHQIITRLFDYYADALEINKKESSIVMNDFVEGSPNMYGQTCTPTTPAAIMPCQSPTIDAGLLLGTNL